MFSLNFNAFQNAIYVGIPHALSKSTQSKANKDRVMSIRAASVDSQTWSTYFSSQEVSIQLPDVRIFDSFIYEKS